MNTDEGGVDLNLVVLRVADLDRAASFYSRLGLKFTRHRHGKGPEHLSAEMGGAVFELYPLTADGPASTGARVGFKVGSVEAVLAALMEFPGVILTPAQDSEWGRRAVVKDPDGHRVELVAELRRE
jgi:lactoylglutathione lyase